MYSRSSGREKYDVLRPVSPCFDPSLHPFCTRKMATIVKQKSGRWPVQVRRKGRYLSETFSLRKDAEAWARRVERDLDVGRKPIPRKLETTARQGPADRPRPGKTLIEFGKARAREGAGGMTLGIDLGYIRTLLADACAGPRFATRPGTVAAPATCLSGRATRD